jgi:hypothetical protein
MCPSLSTIICTPRPLSSTVDDNIIITHLLGHDTNIRVRTIIHHRVGEHQIDIPLKFERIDDLSVLNLGFDSLEIHGPLDDLVIVRRFRWLDGVVEDIAIAVCRYLRVKHGDDGLETLRGNPVLDWL